MNKHELVKEVARTTGLKREEVEKAIDAALSAIMVEVGKGGQVSIPNFGVFETKKRAERNGINPRTKASLRIPETRRPAFRPGSRFKEIVGT